MAESNNHTHSSFSHSAYSVAELINVFQLCSYRIRALYEHSSEDFKTLGVAARNHYQQISSIHQIVKDAALPDQHSNLLVKAAKESLICISHIITDLQFDDIVRQKLEHIQQTTIEIIQELTSIQQKTDKVCRPIKYIYVLSEITKLHAAQLKLTNHDYQKAFTGIKSNLKGVIVNSTHITDHIHYLLNQPELAAFETELTNLHKLTEQLAAQINCTLDKIKYCEPFQYDVEEITKDLQKIFSGRITGIRTKIQKGILAQLKEMYTMESERAVHNKVVDIKASRIQIAKEASDAPDDNIELF